MGPRIPHRRYFRRRNILPYLLWTVCSLIPAQLLHAGQSTLEQLLREAKVRDLTEIQVPAVSPAPAVSLDTHKHFSDFDFFAGLDPGLKTFEGIWSEMQDARIQRAFLLSEAYTFRDVSQNPAHSAKRFYLNRELSEFIAGHPGKFFGFCGINTAWDDRDEVLRECLKLPHMIGVKMNMRYHHQTLTSSGQRARLETLLKAANPYRAVFLIHLNLETNPAGEIKEFLALTRRYPRLTFIIAHAAENALSVLHTLGQKSGEPGSRNNIYTEVSTFISRPPSELAAALRAFGIERVLFGTDSPDHYSRWVVEEFMKLPLTDGEKDLILRQNGEKLIAKITAP